MACINSFYYAILSKLVPCPWRFNCPSCSRWKAWLGQYIGSLQVIFWRSALAKVYDYSIVKLILRSGRIWIDSFVLFLHILTCKWA